MKLLGRLTDVADLTPRDRAAMFVLMDRHYSGVCRRAFEADLAEKQWVIEVRQPATDELCGFSTQMLLDAALPDERPVKALFSGDTIIDRRFWGDAALTHIWGRLALSLIDTIPHGELYWFLVSQGYKTYRFLPVFFHEFYPRVGRPTPAWATNLIDAFARAKFPRSYDAAAQIIRAGQQQYRLRAGIADLTPERLRDPHVRHFMECNPGHARGDEVCCLAPLTRENFTAAAYRVIGPEPALETAP